MEAMVREQVLQKVTTPVSKELIPQATFAHGQWISTRLSVFAAAYNTNIIKRADAPKTYEELLNPRFKGKLAVEAEDANWFMSVVLSMGEEKGLKLFRDIVARNGMSVRKGHTLLANLVPTGEVPLALTAYSYRVEQLKNERAPIEIVYLPPPVAFPTGIGMFRRAPHPHAALLFGHTHITQNIRQLGARQPHNVVAGVIGNIRGSARLSRFQFLRAFKRRYGMPPACQRPILLSTMAIPLTLAMGLRTAAVTLGRKVAGQQTQTIAS
jgi:hypothetical protein